jgi:uncharacterized protein (DUF1015 family)
LIRIAPFRGLRYDPERVSFISRVVAPPYDLIEAELAESLRRKDPHNVVRLILGKEGPDGRSHEEYRQAAETLAEWRRQGVLVQEELPAAYVCEQTFSLGGKSCVRHGLLCVLLLEEFSSGHVMPHERTMSAPKADRLRLMTACRANLSPIFGVFADAAGRADACLRALATGEPLYEFCGPDSDAYRLWRVPGAALASLAALLKQERLLIADGHHRYETALRYRQLNRCADALPGTAPEDFVLLFCVSVKNTGLRILPTHRLVKVPEGFSADAFAARLSERFEVCEQAAGTPNTFRELCAGLVDECADLAFFVAPGRFFLLHPRSDDAFAATAPVGPPEWHRLAVTRLHHAVLEPLLAISADTTGADPRLSFTQDPGEAFWAVEGGRFDLAFLLPPVQPATVETVARAGERMPPKSTFFYPKIASGLVLYAFDGAGGAPAVS